MAKKYIPDHLSISRNCDGLIYGLCKVKSGLKNVKQIKNVVIENLYSGHFNEYDRTMTIMSFDKKSKYKIKTTDYVDAVNQFGVEPGGRLLAKWQFIQLGGMLLVPVGGKLYTEAEDRDKKSEQNGVKFEDLKPGVTYHTVARTQMIFLGKCILPETNDVVMCWIKDSDLHSRFAYSTNKLTTKLFVAEKQRSVDVDSMRKNMRLFQQKNVYQTLAYDWYEKKTGFLAKKYMHVFKRSQNNYYDTCAKFFKKVNEQFNQAITWL